MEYTEGRVSLLTVSKEKLFLYDHIAINTIQNITLAFNPSTN